MKRLSLLIVAVTLFANATALAAADPKPKVLVTVVVDAPLLKTRLGDRLTTTTTDAAAAMRTELQKHFPYLDWVISGPAAQQFTATIRQRQESGDLETTVEYRGSVEHGERTVSVLFEWWNQPPIDQAALEEALRKRLVEDVGLAHPKIEEYFATRVPLVTRVEVDAENERVIVPVSGVIPEDESELRVEFTRGGLRGFIHLTDAMPLGANGILCIVERFSDPPVVADKWHSRVPSVVSARDVTVRMFQFRKSVYPNTNSGSANNP